MFWRLPKQLPISACVSCPAGQPASKSATSQLIVGVAIPSVQMNTRAWWESACGCCCCVRLRFDWSVPLQHWNASRLAYCVTASSTPNYQSYTVTRACGACFLVRRQFDAVRKKKSYKKKRTRFVDQLERKKLKRRRAGRTESAHIRGISHLEWTWEDEELWRFGESRQNSFFVPFFLFHHPPTHSTSPYHPSVICGGSRNVMSQSVQVDAHSIDTPPVADPLSLDTLSSSSHLVCHPNCFGRKLNLSFNLLFLFFRRKQRLIWVHPTLWRQQQQPPVKNRRPTVSSPRELQQVVRIIFHQQQQQQRLPATNNNNNTGRPSTAVTLPAVKEVWSWWLRRSLLLLLLQQLRPAGPIVPNPSAM